MGVSLIVSPEMCIEMLSLRDSAWLTPTVLVSLIFRAISVCVGSHLIICNLFFLHFIRSIALHQRAERVDPPVGESVDRAVAKFQLGCCLQIAGHNTPSYVLWK